MLVDNVCLTLLSMASIGLLHNQLMVVELGKVENVAKTAQSPGKNLEFYIGQLPRSLA